MISKRLSVVKKNNYYMLNPKYGNSRANVDKNYYDISWMD